MHRQGEAEDDSRGRSEHPEGIRCVQATRIRQVLQLQIDVYPVHTAKDTLQWLKEKNLFIRLCYVPAGYTPKAQVLDTDVNRPFKHFIKQCFTIWTVEVLGVQLAAGRRQRTSCCQSRASPRSGKRALSGHWMPGPTSRAWVT